MHFLYIYIPQIFFMNISTIYLIMIESFNIFIKKKIKFNIHLLTIMAK